MAENRGGRGGCECKGQWSTRHERRKGGHRALSKTIDLPVRACGSRIGHEWKRCVRISLIPKVLVYLLLSE